MEGLTRRQLSKNQKRGHKLHGFRRKKGRGKGNGTYKGPGVGVGLVSERAACGGAAQRAEAADS